MADNNKFNSLDELSQRLRDDLIENINPNKSFNTLLLFAFNATGKTRLSMSFSNYYLLENDVNERDTLYYNSFIEDLFVWNNDLEDYENHTLILNQNSDFFQTFQDYSLDNNIQKYFSSFTDVNFLSNYHNWSISFYKEYPNPNYNPDESDSLPTCRIENIKISRAEETLFYFSVFLAICDLIKLGDNRYNWVKYIYIDDPISSLDENKAVEVAENLYLIIDGINKSNRFSKPKFIISTHHSLFFNIMFNVIKEDRHFKSYFLHYDRNSKTYSIKWSNDTPFLYHIAMLWELDSAINSNTIYSYHFNILRSIIEKTASFFGYSRMDECLDGIEDKESSIRTLQIMSHGNYSMFAPLQMTDDNKTMFIKIYNFFMNKYKFNLEEFKKLNQ